MIELTPKIKNDLSSSINNFDLLFVIISSGSYYYLSTRSQTFDNIYYNDIVMKVGGLSESINLKDKKIKLSGTSITLNNAKINGTRFSDTIVGEMSGGVVDIYIKTQSCAVITDCNQVASLKITGVTHNSSSITLKCEDRFIDEFHKELPRVDDTLYANRNTFLGDNEKRIPILYGHLENAPARVYINQNIGAPFSNNNISIIPDRAFLDDSNIIGIKPISPFALSDPARPNQLINNSSLSIKLGDHAAIVYSEPPDRINKVLKLGEGDNLEYEIDWKTQYSLNDNNTAVILNTSSDPDSPKFISKGSLLCGEISKLLQAKTSVIRYAVSYNPENVDEEIIARKIFLQEHTFDIDEKYSDMLSIIQYKIYDSELHYNTTADNVNFNGSYRRFDLPVFELEFEQIKSSVKKAKGIEKDTMSDGNIIGAFNNKMTSHYTGYSYDQHSIGLEYCIFPSQANYISRSEDENGAWTETHIGVVKMITEPITSSFDGDYPQWEDYHYNYLPKFAHRFTEKSPFRIKSIIPDWQTGGGMDYSTEDYRNTFQTKSQDNIDNEINTWRMDDEWIDIADWVNTNIFTGYLVPNWPTSPSDIDDWDYPGNYLKLELESSFNSTMYKRSWYQTEVFNNNFFLNAKGRSKPTPNTEFSESNWNKILKVENLQIQYVSSNTEENGVEELEQENTVLELYDFLVNDKFKKIYYQNNMYDIVFEGTIQGTGGTVGITLYDIDITSFTANPNSSNTEYTFVANGTILRKDVDDDSQWIWSFNGGNQIHIESLKLRYGRKIYEDDILSEFEYLDDINDNVDAFPQSSMVTVENIRTKIEFENNDTNNRYVIASFVPFITNILYSVQEMITKPSDVIDDLMKKELGLLEDVNKINVIDEKYQLDFSIYKDEEGIDVLQKISQSSPFFYRTSLYSGVPSVVGIKDTYTDDDIDKSINENQIIRYKFAKSKIEDVALKCRVKYGYDYVSEEYSKTTEDIEHISHIHYSYMNLYDLRDPDTYTLEYEAEYIQDDLVAHKLANHIFELNKNQHLLLSFQIPLGDGIELEIGDIIDFIDNYGNRTNIGNTKPYGMDMSIENTIIDQVVYPYFMITSIKKDLTKADIECVQLHKLEEREYGIDEYYQYELGDINMDQNIDILDLILLTDMILGGGINNPNYTDEEKYLANIDGNQVISILDTIQLLELIIDPNAEQENPVADIAIFNNDGTENSSGNYAEIGEYLAANAGGSYDVNEGGSIVSYRFVIEDPDDNILLEETVYPPNNQVIFACEQNGYHRGRVYVTDNDGREDIRSKTFYCGDWNDYDD